MAREITKFASGSVLKRFKLPQLITEIFEISDGVWASYDRDSCEAVADVPLTPDMTAKVACFASHSILLGHKVCVVVVTVETKHSIIT
jgi:hypothetical protein